MTEVFFKFIRFCVVGFSGLLIDYSLTYVGKEKMKMNKYVANGIGFLCAATTNFLLNQYWTFEDKNPDDFIQFSQYLSIALIGLGINTLVIYLLVNKKDMNFYLAKLIAIGVAIIWNFTANYNLTFA